MLCVAITLGGLLSMGCGSFPVGLYLATGKSTDKDKSDFFVNPTGALGFLAGNPIPRSRHKRPPPPSTLRSRGPLTIIPFRRSALLTARLGSPWSRASIQARFQKKLWGINFFFTRT